jgi:hypothetical protein
MPPSFPRSAEIPSQSPLFWVAHKDRYLRQLLIGDIEEQTGRKLIVYFTDCDRTQASIDISDDAHLAELLSTVSGSPTDLMLETNGGATDTTEKICSMLRQAVPDLRVIVPRRAKSNGTVIALCGTHILMGAESELGPIDPSIAGIPVEFLLNAPAGSFTAIDIQAAEAFRKQTRKLAKSLLSSGMMKGNQTGEIEETVEKLATRDHYHSHGSVIDAKEAAALKLSIIEHGADDPLWRKIWLLRTMYQYDCGARQYAKVFEGVKISSAVTAVKPSAP